MSPADLLVSNLYKEFFTTCSELVLIFRGVIQFSVVWLAETDSVFSIKNTDANYCSGFPPCVYCPVLARGFHLLGGKGGGEGGGGGEGNGEEKGEGGEKGGAGGGRVRGGEFVEKV